MVQQKLPIRLMLFLSAIFSVISQKSSALKISTPVSLKTEYLYNPLGLDTPLPRFTWQLNDSRQGAKQTF